MNHINKAGDNQAQVAVVTGAGSGIGKELILQLAAMGYGIAAADINAEQLAAAAAETSKLTNAQVKTYRLNVAEEEAVNQFAQQVEADFGRVDVVINNAGITRMGEFKNTSPDAFRAVIDVNFWGVIYGSRAFLPALEKTAGSLINISSVFGFIGVAGQTSYCASKFAVRGFTEALRQELHDSPMHIASVHPGGIRTNIARSAEVDEEGIDKDAVVARMEEKALKMPASKAAGIIINGIQKRKPRILIGSDARMIDIFQRLFPTAYSAVLSMFGGKDLINPPRQ